MLKQSVLRNQHFDMQAGSCRTSAMDKLAAKMDVKILYSVLVFHGRHACVPEEFASAANRYHRCVEDMIE